MNLRENVLTGYAAVLNKMRDLEADIDNLRRAYFDATKEREVAKIAETRETRETKRELKYIYVSGPMTSSGNLHLNARDAFLVASELRRLGFIPFVPHATIAWDMIDPVPYEEWIEYDLRWIDRCDALFRMPGMSKGADIERKYAQSVGKPTFDRIEELVRARDTWGMDARPVVTSSPRMPMMPMPRRPPVYESQGYPIGTDPNLIRQQGHSYYIDERVDTIKESTPRQTSAGETRPPTPPASPATDGPLSLPGIPRLPSA